MASGTAPEPRTTPTRMKATIEVEPGEYMARTPKKQLGIRKPTAVGYVRVSTGKQDISIESQKAKIAAWATMNGVEIVEVCVDDGVSGKSTERPGLARAIQIIESGQAAALVFAKFDRLSRSQRDMIEFVRTSQRDGWALVSIAEQFDTSTPMGRFFIGLMAAFAELERETIVARTRDAHQTLREQGLPCSGTLSSGFWMRDGKMVPRPEVLEVVLRTLSTRTEQHRGKHPNAGARTLAKRLNEAKVYTTNGNTWTPNSAARLVKTYLQYGVLEKAEG